MAGEALELRRCEALVSGRKGNGGNKAQLERKAVGGAAVAR